MSTNRKKRREQLYNEYAANLKLVKPRVTIEPDIDDTIICPICFRIHTRADLEIPQAITLDHIPPKALGGRDSQGVLTCGNCNSKSGDKVDAHAKIHLSTMDFVAGIPGASKDGQFALGSIPSSDAEFHYDDKGRLNIRRNPKRMNLALGRQESDFLQSMVGEENMNTPAQMKFTGANLQLVSVAWLRYAYLSFFRCFGYLGVLHETFNEVRRQILHPNEAILPNTWELNPAPFINFPEGMHAIQSPVALQSYIVIFDVATSLRVRRKAVVLPKLGKLAQYFYEEWEPLWIESAGGSLAGEEVPQMPEYWTNLYLCARGLFQSFKT
jgi:hypothetical protein